MKRALFVIFALCAILLVANTYWVDSRTRAADAREGGQIIATSVVPANVRVEGSGPVIVLIHGFGAAIDWWDKVTPGLATDHRVISIDLIGHGGTEAPRSGYTIPRQAQLVVSVLDKLGVDRFAVVGHSMGGEVATAIAEMKPERIERMILIDSPPTPATTFTILTDAYLEPVLGEFLTHFQDDRDIHRGLEQGFAPGFPVPPQFITDFKQLTYTAFREAHDDSIAYRTEEPTSERLAALKPVPPLLAIFGTRDRIVPASQAKYFERVPGAKIAMIEGAGHSPQVETPDKVLELIRELEQAAQQP